MDGGRVMPEGGRDRPTGSRPTRRGVNGYTKSMIIRDLADELL
jgi:hypothetical protein